MGQLFVVGQVVFQGPGGDLGVALAELGYEQLVRLTPPVVLTGVSTMTMLCGRPRS